MKDWKETGKCPYCGDPIYDHQEIGGKGKKRYHKGCYNILLAEEAKNKTS